MTPKTTTEDRSVLLAAVRNDEGTTVYAINVEEFENLPDHIRQLSGTNPIEVAKLPKKAGKIITIGSNGGSPRRSIRFGKFTPGNVVLGTDCEDGNGKLYVVPYTKRDGVLLSEDGPSKEDLLTGVTSLTEEHVVSEENHPINGLYIDNRNEQLFHLSNSKMPQGPALVQQSKPDSRLTAYIVCKSKHPDHDFIGTTVKHLLWKSKTGKGKPDILTNHTSETQLELCGNMEDLKTKYGRAISFTSLPKAKKLIEVRANETESYVCIRGHNDLDSIKLNGKYTHITARETESGTPIIYGVREDRAIRRFEKGAEGKWNEQHISYLPGPTTAIGMGSISSLPEVPLYRLANLHPNEKAMNEERTPFQL